MSIFLSSKNDFHNVFKINFSAKKSESDAFFIFSEQYAFYSSVVTLLIFFTVLNLIDLINMYMLLKNIWLVLINMIDIAEMQNRQKNSVGFAITGWIQIKMLRPLPFFVL